MIYLFVVSTNNIFINTLLPQGGKYHLLAVCNVERMKLLQVTARCETHRRGRDIFFKI